MVVDDSVVVRGLIGRWIDEDPHLAVVASHRNGRLAVEDVARSDPDVVVLDLEMPDMDGLTALPLLLGRKRDLVVLLASTLTRRNAEISLRALALGAADYVPKPESSHGVTTSADFRRELIEKIAHLGRRARTRSARTGSARPPVTRSSPARTGPDFTLRGYSKVPPRIVAIGSSTGGPQALSAVFAEIGAAIAHVPVVVTQHMPPTFTTILAEHVAKSARRPALEGRDGDRLLPGHIYVAPGGRHMVLARSGPDVVVRLTDGPPVNFCKPAVDPLFQSVSEIYGNATLALVLTGMGTDGAEGVRCIGASGGTVIAQDEESSVVWGMPGAAAHTGQCSDVLPLPEIGRRVARILLGGRP
jgi:two-component system chemotaxis response regulator CheB